MDEGSTLPVPFNMVPTPKSAIFLWRFCKELLNLTDPSWAEYNIARKQTFIKVRSLLVKTIYKGHLRNFYLKSVEKFLLVAF